MAFRAIRPAVWAAAPILVLVISACEDAPSEPGLLVAAESQAALQVAGSLPTLPGLLARAGLREEGVGRASASPLAPVPDEQGASRARDAELLWLEASQSGDSVTAETMRATAYALAIPWLSQRLDAAGLAAAHASLEKWIRMGDAVMNGARVEGISAPLQDGKVLLDKAREAAATGDKEGAIRATLQASDRLASTTPQAVALRLTREAETMLTERREAGASAAELERIDRLVRGAREAWSEGKYPLAIRRAYYAGRLLKP